ncbi:ABC transporter permease [Paenibacillus eucommiae]|uniref:ABC-2 type transport system permease protein n=1 Tax=Paenibacillus eucommiae TaxID=1355755 RepID=A0ABS4IVI1_9BACL|nr:ABC transporter permease [Paenibacillus eucommiae]MBP1991593.1 ABC-2 type transport system permease protein [Paenibacillus eucommiae]
MTFSMRRVFAIFHKDYKDVSRNMYVTTTVVLPLIMAVFFGRLGIENVESHYIVINMAFILVATYVQSSLIAEEKEKKTLRGLMLSPASTIEIFCGKSLLSFISTLAIIFLSVLLTGYNPNNALIVVIALFLSAIFYLGVGTLIGLLTKSVMEASVAIIPAIGIFTLGSFVTPFIEKYPILAIAEYLPNLQLIDLAKQVETGAGLAELWPNLGIILLWSVAIYSLCVYLYKKSMVDE